MNKVELEPIEFAEYIIKKPMPIRDVAKEFNTNKSKVHRGLTLVLKRIDGKLYSEVREILNNNKVEGVKKGAIATRMKWKQHKMI